MKKIFTLFAMMVVAIAANAMSLKLYAWESPAGIASEIGGTIAYVNGDGNRLNYANDKYFTICLNGKKANLADATASANAGHMVITFDNELKAGDQIVMTAYYNKGEDKKVSAWLVFENGTTAYSAVVTQDIARDGKPEEITVVVPAEADGSKTLTLTRNDSGTNMFITKLVVNGERPDEELEEFLVTLSITLYDAIEAQPLGSDVMDEASELAEAILFYQAEDAAKAVDEVLAMIQKVKASAALYAKVESKINELDDAIANSEAKQSVKNEAVKLLDQLNKRYDSMTNAELEQAIKDIDAMIKKLAEEPKPTYDYTDIPDGIEPMDDYHAAIVRNGAFVEGEDGTKWWTVEGFGKAAKQANSKHSAIEAYAGWGSLDVTEYSLNQRQYVSAGRYQMRCSGFFRQGEAWSTDPTTSNAVIYVNEEEVPLATLGSESAKTYANSQATAAGVFDADMYVNTLDFTLEESQEINFGVKGTFDTARSWCIIGGIEIIRVDGYNYEKEVDVTAQYLENPSFENSTAEWTVEGSWKEQNNGEAVKVGENYVEQWQAAGGLPAGKVYQTISIPNGTYRISAIANATASGTFLFANDQKTEATSPAQEISVVAKVTDGQLTLGYERSEENQANWVAVDNFRIYEIQDKNTLLEADNYVITALVEPAEGVDPALIPEAFQKYLGIYTTTATLVGDENSLVITENAEEGLFDGFEVKGNAVAFSPEKVITLGGQKFTVRDAQNEGDSEETGELEIIPTNVKGYFFMEGADVYFNGKKIVSVPTIVIRTETTVPVETIEEQVKEAAQQSNAKFFQNGRLVIVDANGNMYNAAGQIVK